MKKKIFITIVVLMTVCLALAPFIDTLSYEEHDSALKRSIASFAIAKSLNAVISLLQGTEIGVSFVANATVSIGELLDPLNDMVERFSWVMLASSVALGIEKILIKLGATWILKYIFISFGGVFILSLWMEKLRILRVAFGKIFLILLLLRFIMPLTMGINSLIYTYNTEPTYQKAQNTLSVTTDELNSAKDDLTSQDLSYFETLQKKFSDISEDMIDLMVIFIFQTIILPLFTIWFCYKSMLYILRFKPYVR